MRMLVLMVTIFFLTSTCQAEAPSNYIYLPITVSAQKFKEEHPAAVNDQRLLPSVDKTAIKGHRLTLADFENDANAGRDILAGDINPKYAGFIASVTPNYKVKRPNPLALVQVPYQRNKEALMFVFLMNGKSYKDKPVRTAQWKKKSHFHMHVMGSKKVFQEQAIVDDKPVNLSFSRYEDGFSTEDLNLVLPSKKPRKFMVSFMWAF